MHLSIGQKIFSAALCCLLLTSAVAGYSFYQTQKIADEIRDIAAYRLPLSETVNRLNEYYLRHNAAVHETIDLSLLETDIQTALQHHQETIQTTNQKAKQAFAEAYALLQKVNEAETIQHINMLEESFATLELHGKAILSAKHAGHHDKIPALLRSLGRMQNKLETDIVKFRGHLTSAADKSVSRVNRAEQHLLQVSSLSMIVAIVSSALVAIFVTRRITYRLHRLKKRGRSRCRRTSGHTFSDHRP